MTPEELAVKHFPYNTTCPMKRKKIDWQREQLAREIKENFLQLSGGTGMTHSGFMSSNHTGGESTLVFTTKAELK